MKRPIALLLLAFGLVRPASAQTPGKTVVVVDPRLEQIVSPDAVLEKVAPGTGFYEGPVWIAGRPGYLIFSDVSHNVINRLGPNGALSVVVDKIFTGDPSTLPDFDTGVNGIQKLMGPDGVAVDRDGRITYCEYGAGRVTRVEKDGTRTVLADRFEGRRLNNPNDLVYKSDGALYFTDSGVDTTRPENDPRKGNPFRGVYRVKDGQLQLLTKEFSPNGIAFSPDEKYLYTTQAGRKLLRFDVQPDGTIANGRIFFDLDIDNRPGSPDGLKTDRDGNVYSTGPAGVWIISPEGKHRGTLLAPARRFVNFTFGGDDGRSLYLVAPEGVYRLPFKNARVR